MSSLAAVQADGFYYPPDFDPKKHGSLNAYHGTHALRERAARIDQGILVIRFEVPFHIWCDKCGEKIAKGERFNADKKAIGMYHSTKILQFSMRHHCGCLITIQTDPKRAEYIVVEGAKKKVEDVLTAEDKGVIELMDDTERERLALDPIYRLEQGEASRKRARTAAEEVEDLLVDARAKHSDAYAINAQLRSQMRVARKEREALEARRKELHLPESVELLPDSEQDAHAAALAFYDHDKAGHGLRAEQTAQRQAILNQPIFPPQQRKARTGHTGPRLPPATAGPSNAQGGGGGFTERSGDSDESARDHGAGAAAYPAARGTSAAGGSKRGAKGDIVPASGKGQSGQGADGGGDQQALILHPAAEQPGAGNAKPVPTTQAAVKERATTLQAAHQAAQRSVAAWRAGRASRASAAQEGKGPGGPQHQAPPAGSAAHAAALKRSVKKLDPATKLKAQLLAQRSRKQAGMGL